MWRWVAFPLLKWETAADFERQLLTDLTLSTDSYHWDGWLASFGQGCLRVSLDFTNMPPPPHTPPLIPLPRSLRDRNVTHHLFLTPWSALLLPCSWGLPASAVWMQISGRNMTVVHEQAHIAQASLPTKSTARTAVYECVWSVCMNIMGWRAVVLSGREEGVAEWAASCVHMGGGGRGNGRPMDVMEIWRWVYVCVRACVCGGGGVAACFRWKDSCAYRIEGARWSVEDDGVALECMCTRTCMCKGHSSKSNGQWPDVGLCCYAICMSCTVGNTAKWPLECRERPHIFAAPAHWDLNLIP